MADENKILEGEFASDVGIARLWQRIKQSFVRKDGDKVLSDNNFSDEEKEKLAGLHNYELPVASEEELGGIRIGAGLAIDEDGVVSVESAGQVDWEDVQNKPDTLEGYGITDAATKEELEEVAQKVTRMYERKGSLDTVADLDTIQNPEYGWTYDIRENGHNYAWTEGDPDFWDDLGGTFQIKPLTEHDIDVITGYASSEEIFDEILEEGGEIELADDMTLTGQKVITNDVVIDLAGYTLDTDVPKSAKQYLLVADGAKLTLKNGRAESNYRLANAINGGEIIIDDGCEIGCGDVALAATGEGSKVTMNDGLINAVEGGIGAFEGAEIEMNGGEINISDNFALFTNGTAGKGGNTITVNGGTLVGNITSAGFEACGVYIANNDTFVMNGGEILANNGAGLCMRAGDVEINDGMIISTGEAGTTGKIGDGNFQMGKSAVIYHEKANYPGKEGMKLTINGGTFIGVDHSLEILSNEAEPQVFVNGGNFTPDYPEV